MAVTPGPKDVDGTQLQAGITALTAAIAAMSSTLTKHSMSVQLDHLQRQLVGHYLDVNRIQAATILSTLS